MYKPLLNIPLILVVSVMILLVGCAKEFDKQRFIAAYTEILIAREQVTDTTIANTKVRDILTKYSYTEPEFRTDFFELAKKPNEMRTVMDSVHQRVRSQTTTTTNR